MNLGECEFMSMLSVGDSRVVGCNFCRAGSVGSSIGKFWQIAGMAGSLLESPHYMQRNESL